MLHSVTTFKVAITNNNYLFVMKSINRLLNNEITAGISIKPNWRERRGNCVLFMLSTVSLTLAFTSTSLFLLCLTSERVLPSFLPPLNTRNYKHNNILCVI